MFNDMQQSFRLARTQRCYDQNNVAFISSLKLVSTFLVDFGSYYMVLKLHMAFDTSIALSDFGSYYMVLKPKI
jgi:hypothetical protein